MPNHREGLWRIEYRTNLTRANTAVIGLGFLLEAQWENDIRWLGMLFRRKINPIENDFIDQATWPELNSNLEAFMTGLFEEAWSNSRVSGGRAFGSDAIVKKFSMHSALQFAPEACTVSVNPDDAVASFTILYSHLLQFRNRLIPLSAPVLPLKKRKPMPAVARADVELANKAA
jgi:hypothetical protein